MKEEHRKKRTACAIAVRSAYGKENAMTNRKFREKNDASFGEAMKTFNF